MFFFSNKSVKHYILMIVQLLFVGFAGVSIAQAEPVPLSLKESVALSLQHNQMIHASEAATDQARAQARESEGYLYPRVDLSTGVARTNSPLAHFGSKLQQQSITPTDFAIGQMNNPGYITNYQSRLGLTMPLFAGGKLWAGKAQSEHQLEVREYELAFSRQQLIFQTVTAYVQVKQAQAQLVARKQSLLAANKRWQDAKNLQKRGMAIQSDVMDAHVHVLNSQLALDAAKSGYGDAMDRLKQLMGGQNDADASLALAEPEIRFARESLDMLLEQGQSKRMDLKALEASLQAANAAMDGARSGYLPEVYLTATQEWNSSTIGLKHSNTTMGAMVKMNVFSGGSDRARIQAAVAGQSSAQAQIEGKKIQISNEIRQAWRALEIADKRVQTQQEALTQRKESLRIKEIRQQQGLETTSELLDAQARLDAARENDIRAGYDALLAKAALLLAAGNMTEGVVQP